MQRPSSLCLETLPSWRVVMRYLMLHRSAASLTSRIMRSSTRCSAWRRRTCSCRRAAQLHNSSPQSLPTVKCHAMRPLDVSIQAVSSAHVCLLHQSGDKYVFQCEQFTSTPWLSVSHESCPCLHPGSVRAACCWRSPACSAYCVRRSWWSCRMPSRMRCQPARRPRTCTSALPRNVP